MTRNNCSTFQRTTLIKDKTVQEQHGTAGAVTDSENLSLQVVTIYNPTCKNKIRDKIQRDALDKEW